MHLTKIEIILCFTIYLSFLLYGFYDIISIRTGILQMVDYEFPPGWKFIGNPYDNSSLQFESFKAHLYQSFIWYFLHILAAEVIKCFDSKFVPAAHFLIGASYIIQTYEPIYQLVIAVQFISFYFLQHFHSKLLGWGLSSLWIIYIHTIKQSSSYYTSYAEYYEAHLTILVLSWNVMRGLSFLLDKQIEWRNKSDTLKQNSFFFMTFAGYFFYFPTFVFGPFCMFERYVKLVRNDFWEVDALQRVKKLVLDLLKVGFWLFFFNVSLHYFYIYYLAYDHKAVRLLSFLGLYGFGFMMGLYFYLFYIITYGLGISFLRYDGINPPRQPICIARVHFYSKMWRYFDEGLYDFLFKYIYSELQTKSSSVLRKLFAASITFLFIYVWHGMATFIFIWSALNLFSIILEKLFKMLWRSHFFSANVVKRLSERNQSRLFGLIGCHLYHPSVAANFYFLTGVATGNYFVELAYTNGFGHYLVLAAIAYSIFQVCEWISRRSEEVQNKSKRKD